jgi:endonuclease/exonuclease/phosphatase family protein
MAPERWLARASRALVPTVLALCVAAPAAHALRVVNYNITNYPGLNLAGRQPHFRTILAGLSADIVVVQEMQSQAGVDSFRANVLNVVEPGQWASAPFINGNDTDNGLFYRTSKVQLLGQWAWYPSATNLRLVNCYRLKPVGYAAASAELRIYSQHLKASQGFETDRFNEAIGIRDSMNAVPPGTHCILTGDFNIYTGAEPAFTRFRESQADNDGRLYDPLNAPLITWNTGSLAAIHTQSPCSTCPGGFATGGLDDRFDMFLPTYNLNDGEGLDLLVSTYKPVGNDGLHYNLNITDAPTIPEGSAYATALWNASDHLPIRVDLQLPPRISASAALALGNVIVGAAANQTLAVSNIAGVPADELSYTLSAPAGFSAPGGSFAANAGASASNHTIGMSTATAGIKAGTLTVSSDDVDLPTFNVSLGGTVLDHAAASLDSSTSLLATPVDFGDHEIGQFSNHPVRAHDLGYDALQARLSVNSANIVGGDGRFSIVGGFSPALLAGTGRTWSIHFDDGGASLDQEYTATLTLASTDEALPGSAAASDLTVSLRAKPLSGTTGVPGGELPKALAFHAPRPNPLVRDAVFAFDLPQAAPVSLAIYDLSGRKVASLVSGSLGPGRHLVPWSAVSERGPRVPGGLYFARFITPGMSRVARLIVLP